MNDHRPYYLAAISAFVLWGFFPVELRFLHAFDAGTILYFRVVFALVSLVLLAVWRKKVVAENGLIFMGLNRSKKWEMAFITFAGAALLSANWLVFIYVVNNISIKTASFSYFICPVLTAVLGFVLLKESLSRLQWVSVALCAISCFLVGMESVKELGYSLLVALSYALYLISQRRNLQFDRLLVLSFHVLFALLLMTPFYPILVNNTPIDPVFYVHTLFIALVFTILPLFLNLYALKRLSSATLGIFMYLNPMVGFSVAFLFYKESARVLQIGGYVLIGFAILLFNAESLLKTNKNG